MENFEFWVIYILVCIVFFRAIWKIFTIIQFQRKGYRMYDSLILIIKRRLGDAFVQFLLLGGIYTLVINDFIYLRYTGIVLSFIGIIKVCKRLLSEVLGPRTFLSKSEIIEKEYKKVFPPWLLAIWYLFHFISNFFYVIWLFACLGVGFYLTNSEISYSIINSSGSLFMDFFYFSIVTISTLGYGDISPISKIAKGLAIFEVFVGIFILFLYLSAIMTDYFERLKLKSP